VTDCRSVFAEVLRHCFPDQVDLGKVFPGAELMPVGLMQL
jgi:hypothetical protein